MEQKSPQTTPLDPKTLIHMVLLVDDDENWIFVSKLNLKKAGVGKKIITARNGREALDILQAIAKDQTKKLPELIFLDIRMPVMNGFEFLEESMKTDSLDLSQSKVYMCSSSLNPEDKERAAAYPISGFLTKPITQEILKEILG